MVVFSAFSSGILRDGFGNPSGVLEEIPKKYRSDTGTIPKRSRSRIGRPGDLKKAFPGEIFIRLIADLVIRASDPLIFVCQPGEPGNAGGA
jgi:hypothetical protein